MDSLTLTNNNDDRVADVYSGKNIFITGGTGFIGKVLIEKLLRRCPTINQIYVLVRNKKGKLPEERLQETLKSPLFDKLKEILPEDRLLKKLTPITGDVSELNLGISDEQRQELIEKVHFIYHIAATVRFDETLKNATILNVRGTKFMLDLAKQCRQLILHTHVSTAYCHLHVKFLEEKVYDPPYDPKKILQLIEILDDESLDLITKKILSGYPNTYTFTKALAEGLVNGEMDNLPVMILRPSVVVPMWKDPLPGWTDNMNGPIGLLIGAGRGVIRTMYADDNTYADFMPVDVVASAIMLTTWNYVEMKNPQTVYNLTSSSEVKIRWREIINLGKKIVRGPMPLNYVLWYPNGNLKTSRLQHNIDVFLYHTIPAIILDGLLILCGQTPFMMRVKRRVSKGCDVLEYFGTHQWDFSNASVVGLRAVLNKTERLHYPIESNDIDVEQYFTLCVRAARVYLLNEPDDTLPMARRNMKIMYAVDVITKFLLSVFFIWMLLKFAGYM